MLFSVEPENGLSQFIPTHISVRGPLTEVVKLLGSKKIALCCAPGGIGIHQIRSTIFASIEQIVRIYTAVVSPFNPNIDL